MSEAPRICLVDDDTSVRTSLGRLLKSAGFQVSPFESAEAFLEVLPGLDVDCLVLDIRMEGMDGIRLHRNLAETEHPVPVIFLTGHGDIPMSVSAMRRGAEDFLIKPVDEDTLLAAISRALESGRRRRDDVAEQALVRERLRRLSPREMEVLRCLLAGALNKQVAAHLGIVEKTVKVHRARIFEKMESHSLAELARLCDHVGVEPIDL